MRVGEVVGARDLPNVGALHDDRPGRAAEIDRVDDDESVRTGEQLLHEVDAADSDVEHLHRCRDVSLEQPLRHRDSESVVAAQDVADTRDEDPHVQEDMGRMEPILELERRLARYDAAGYPVQHATTRYHLGVVLADAGRVDEAIESLETAVALFDPAALPLEHAKALNALGAALRLAGELEPAEASFEQAAALFERANLEQEHGAALFNLGLVRRERDPVAAAQCFRRSAALLAGGQEAAAARELGATLLALGELDEAMRTLERAVELAGRGDAAGYGGAQNALGLARLAAGEAEGAIESFLAAAGAYPRAVRADEFAMAKANLALAYEQNGELQRARLAARQALGIAEPPEPVARQAAAVLERVGSATTSDLLFVLDLEPRANWEGILREELARSVDAEPDVRRSDAAAWIDGSSVERTEAWLGVLLELPPDQMESLIRAALEALGPRGHEAEERFRSVLSRAAARFHVPQLLRLEEVFGRIAAELGEPWN